MRIKGRAILVNRRGVERLRRWVAFDKQGDILGTGFTVGRFKPACLVFRPGGEAAWSADGRRFARIIEGNMARMLRDDSPERNIRYYQIGRTRRWRGRM